MIDLSILVCSVHTRYNTFLPKMQDQLYNQLAALSEADQQRTEIIVLTDNKQMMLGHKRNVMVEMAQGKYIVFVDDDDRIAVDYIAALLKGTESDADAIVFHAEVRLNGEEAHRCEYSKDFGTDYNNKGVYYRIPNHICCIKREVSLKSSFPNLLYGEDSGYSKVLLPELKTEHKINRVLYYYDYNADTTETQAWKQNRAKVRQGKAVADVVILSKADSVDQQLMTQRAIDTCIQGANGLPVNIIVVEGGMGEYRNAEVMYSREAFNYNGFGNMGARVGKAEWIMLANNDLVFHDGWLHKLIAADNDVVSPYEPNDPRQSDIIENTQGYQCGKHFSGWCFMIRRSTWDAIGGFDTDVDFWCSDDAVIEQVKAIGIKPMIVKDAVVEHLGSETMKAQSDEWQDDRKWRNVYIFNEKYGKNKFASHTAYLTWLHNNKDNLPTVKKLEEA